MAAKNRKRFLKGKKQCLDCGHWFQEKDIATIVVGWGYRCYSCENAYWGFDWEGI